MIKCVAQLIIGTVFVAFPITAIAGPGEDANAAVERWSAAYSANEPEDLVLTYWPDALLFGTLSPVMSEGAGAIRSYFAPLKGSGNKNAIGDKRTIVIDDGAVVVAGFYEFNVVQDGTPTPFPARFTVLVTKRDGVWRIAHHHSSPLAQPKK